MALQKSVIPIGFNGLQTKIDPKNAPIGTFGIMENFVISQFHSLEKRNAFAYIANAKSFENIGTMYRMNDEIGFMTDSEFYAYSEAKDDFIKKGSVISPILSADPVIANTYTQANQDSSVTDNGVFGVVWEDSRGGIRTTIRDLSEETIIVSDYSISATGTTPAIVGVRQYLFYFWAEGSNLMTIRYDVVNSVFSSTSTAISNLSASPNIKNFDVIKFASNLLIAYVSTSSSPNIIRSFYWNANLNVIGDLSNGLPAQQPLNFANASSSVIVSIAASTDLISYFIVAYANGQISTTNIGEFCTFNVNFQPLNSSPTQFFSTLNLSLVCKQFSIIIDDNNNLFILYNINAIGSLNRGSNTYNFKAENVNSLSPTILNNYLMYAFMIPISRGFLYNNRAFFIICFPDDLQGTYFLVREDGIVCAKLFATVATNPYASQPTMNDRQKDGVVTSVSIDETDATDSTFIVSLLKNTKIDSVNGEFEFISSVFSETMFFKPFGIDNSSINRGLFIAGGYVKQYDGYDTIYEQGFHLYPIIFGFTISGTSGPVAPGTYSYKCVYEWTDNSGQLIRSGTSLPLTVTVASSASYVELRIMNLPITAKTDNPNFEFDRTAVITAVYRTTNGGTTYFRIGQSYAGPPNSGPLFFQDANADSDIVGNPVIYTTGGVFDNIGSYACNFLVDAKNRIVIGGTDVDPFSVFYSKEKIEGISIEFSQELSFTVDYFGGKITALGAMDDKIIIFKKTLIYFVAGQGPDALGNGSFTLPQLVSTDAGCNQPHSIVLMSLGLMFKSAKGIYLLNRQLSVEYIGHAVDIYNDLTITSATNLANENRVIFTTLEGRTLVYDTYFAQWYTFTNQQATNSVLGREYWYFCDQNYVYKVTPNQDYDKSGSAIQSRIRTNWINLANIEGFFRVYYIYILGDNQSLPHQLVAKLYYDFKNYPRQTLSIIPNTGLTTYGEASPYGNETPYGGSIAGDYQYVIRPKQQKCTSIMIELFDQFPDGNKSKSFKLSEISIVYGIKYGGNKNISALRRLR